MFELGHSLTLDKECLSRVQLLTQLRLKTESRAKMLDDPLPELEVHPWSLIDGTSTQVLFYRPRGVLPEPYPHLRMGFKIRLTEDERRTKTLRYVFSLNFNFVTIFTDTTQALALVL